MADKNPNSGALFRNKRQEKPSQPSHTGKALVGGVEWYMSAWVNENPTTKEKYFNIKFEQVPG